MQSSSGLRKVGRDLLDLLELQFQLLSVDSQEARRAVSGAVVFVAVGVLLVASALTGLMIGAGYFLHEAAGWSVGVSLLTTSGVGLVIALIAIGLAVRKLQAASSAMAETKRELVENLKWIKAVLISPQTSARNQLRAESFPGADGGSRPEREPVGSSRFNS